MLISLVNAIVPTSFYKNIFNNNAIIDPFIGSLIGSISAGNPITSYIIGGELLKQNISLFTVTAFIVAWVTVGIIQIPAESILLGKNFALFRNIIAFFFAIIVAIITTLLFQIV
jgi:uncharacterized membrane protein YraQ (UPF0718 family)